MHVRLGTAGATLALLATMTIGGSVAFAAAPGNDLYGGATTVSGLPFDDTVDTTSATTDADDTEANTDCGAPVTLASVWYDFTPSADNGYIIDVSGSNYSAGVIVVSGSPGSFVVENCGPGTISFFGAAGVDYHILAFSDTDGVNGGTLRFHMDAAPPPPAVTISLDRVGHVNVKTGIATVSGTWSCTGGADYADIGGQMTQPVGRFSIRGSFYVEPGPCDGTLQRWSATVWPENGKFAGGKTATVAWTYACGPFACAEGYAEARVLLRR